MKRVITRSIRKLLVSLCLFALSGTGAFAYDVWLGLPYFPKGADSTLKDQWELTAPMLDGLNPNLSQTKLPLEERNTTADWKRIIGLMTKAKNNAMTPMPRTHFNYGTRTDKGTLPEYLVKTFKNESRYGYKIKWVMPYDEQPNEDRTLPVYHWTDAELQEMRDWLDNNGHASTRIMFNIRNNGIDGRNFVKKPLVDGYSIEARAKLWFENTGNRPLFLQWAVSDPLTKDKHAKFQMPFGGYDDTAGEFGPPSNMTGYQAMRRCMRWLVTDVLGGNTDLFRRDDVTFLSIVYDPTNQHFPEKSEDGTEYVDGTTSVLLSIMEQKALFDGTAPGGLISIAQCMSYDRITVPTTPEGPEHGLVAHWPLDEGSGTVAGDAADGGLFDGELRNGAAWGSDATRDTYVSFDGTDDRIATPFRDALADADKFTWSWWAKKTTPSGTDNGSIMLGNRYGGTGSENYEFIKFTPVGAQFSNTNDTSQIGKYGYEVPTGVWQHYAMVKNGNSYQLYVNGVARGSTEPPFTYDETSPIPFFIGGDDDGNSNEHFEGCIDDVVLYRSALTQEEIANVINGIYLQTIPMVALGSPVDSTAGSTWSDGEPAHGGANYVIPATGNLRGESGTSTFPGSSLTVEAGGKFQVRSLDGSDEATTVDDLILSGGAGFDAGQFAQLAAGTGTDAINLLDGTITQSGATRLVTYGGTTARILKIVSQINGSGTLQVVGEGVIVNNEDNTFSGTWEVEAGATLTFNDAGSVGSADIDVLDGGGLEIQGHWDSGVQLAVADTSTTSVDLGNSSWSVSNLVFGGSSVAGGTYTTSALNALGSNPVFSGSGIVRVMPPGTMFHSATYNVAGTTDWVCPEGVTSIQVECWGGGGAGGSSSTTGAAQVYVAGGGAAGGAYAKRAMVPVTPGRTYPVTIAPAAVALDPTTAATGDRVHGADISFTGDYGVTVLAKGGQGGQCVINPSATQGGIGGAGSTAGCISDGSGYVFAGGTGYFPPTKGGSGGGGAGDSEDGYNGYLEDPDDDDSASLPGAGGYDGGGEGGIGAAGVGNGGNGFAPGGGGGGARTGRWVATTADEWRRLGGTGGLGQIMISYNDLPAFGTVDPAAPIAHWKLDEGSGSTAIDSSGHGHTGSLRFGANWRSDATRGVHVSFDGDDDRISTPFSYALSSSDDFTWAWWANKQSPADTDTFAVMVGNRYGGTGTEDPEYVKMTPRQGEFADGTTEHYDYADIATGTWHHYAMVKSGTSYQWYVDGVAQGDPVTINYSESSPLPFHIGGDDNDETPGGRETQHFEGYIDDVVLYGRALSPVEVIHVHDGLYTGLPATWLEDWRLLHFGTTGNTGIAADGFDTNDDGEDNLLEFATNQNPHATTLLSTPVEIDGGMIEFRYTRSKAAMADGISFLVKWSDTLLDGSWSGAGVTEYVESDNAEEEHVVAEVPMDTSEARFMHLEVAP